MKVETHNQHSFPARAALRSNARALSTKTADWWRPGFDLECYPYKWQQEEADRLEKLSNAFANGRLSTKGQIERWSKANQCSVRYCLSWKQNKMFMARVKELIKMRAVYGVAEALPSQISLAKKDTQAFKALLQMTEMVQGQIGSRVNVAIDARKMGDTHSDRMFFEEYQKRVEANATVTTDDGTTQ
jgi:hypothetical protein